MLFRVALMTEPRDPRRPTGYATLIGELKDRVGSLIAALLPLRRACEENALLPAPFLMGRSKPTKSALVDFGPLPELAPAFARRTGASPRARS